MPRFAEIAAALYATWRLAHLDTAGFSHFDVSVDGAYKSFFAAVVVAPGYALLLLLSFAGVRFSASGLEIFLMAFGGYVLLWTIFPLAAFYLLRGLAMEDRFRPMLVGYNWAQCLVVYAFLPLAALAASGTIPGIGAIVTIVQFVLAPAYVWFVMRTALKGNGQVAFGLLLLSLAIEIVVMVFIQGRLGPMPG